MHEEWALRRAVVESPDDDLPRLIFADWLDDQGQPDRAAFIRAQIALDRAEPWSAVAAAARHGSLAEADAAAWRHTLPSLGPVAEWHDTRPFRRGFGWCIRVRQLSTFLEFAQELLDNEPVGELVLPAATRDDWDALAAAPWLRRIQALRFTTGSTLSEPVRALARSPHAAGLRSIAFEVSTSPGIGAVVELLLQSPLAGRMRELEFRIGHDRDGDILDELARAPDLALESLTLVTMGHGGEAIARLADLPNPGRLRSLSIRHQHAGGEVATALRSVLRGFPLNQLAMLAGQLAGRDIVAMAGGMMDDALRRLDVSHNTIGEDGLAALCAPGRFEHLRCLNLSRCGLEDGDLARLTAATFWTGLVELDLSHNRITDAGAATLLAAAPVPELAALVLSGNSLGETMRDTLRGRFGAALRL